MMDAVTVSITQQHRSLLFIFIAFFPLLFLCAICVGRVYFDTSGGAVNAFLVADTAPAVF